MWACRPDHVCTWPCHDDDSDWFAHLEVPCWPTVWKCLSLTSSSLVSQRPGFLYRSVWVPKWCSLLRTKIRIDPSFRLFRRNRLLQTLEESSRVWETIRPRKISDHSGYTYRRRWGSQVTVPWFRTAKILTWEKQPLQGAFVVIKVSGTQTWTFCLSKETLRQYYASSPASHLSKETLELVNRCDDSIFVSSQDFRTFEWSRTIGIFEHSKNAIFNFSKSNVHILMKPIQIPTRMSHSSINTMRSKEPWFIDAWIEA